MLLVFLFYNNGFYFLPTPNKTNSAKWPHLKTVDKINNLKLTSPTKMFAVHIENQFHLLREDLVYDAREDMQVALGNKKGRHTNIIISVLLLKHWVYVLPRMIEHASFT